MSGHIVTTDKNKTLCGKLYHYKVTAETSAGNCKDCILILVDEMQAIQTEVYTLRVAVPNYFMDPWCKLCNCNKSQDKDVPNGEALACSDSNCLCHNENV